MARIEVFALQCPLRVQNGKERPSWFSKRACFENLLRTANEAGTTRQPDCRLGSEGVRVTVFFDGDPTGHFVQDISCTLVPYGDGGNGARALRGLLEYIHRQQFDPDTIIYIVEDDFLHMEGWPTILREGIGLGAAYVTLYDHPDKYMPMYGRLTSRVLVTESAHWRTVPSTVNTVAFRFRTLQEDFAIHIKWNSIDAFPYDHQKYLELGRRGRTLISPMPGWSTHCESAYLSPCRDWAAQSRG
jgi:hypothetical protein